MLADTALYLPFALVAGIPPVLLALVVILGVIGEMAGVVAVQIGAERRYDGPLGRATGPSCSVSWPCCSAWA